MRTSLLHPIRSVLLGFACIVLSTTTAGFFLASPKTDWGRLDPLPAHPPAVQEGLSSSFDPDGEQVYMTRCMSCHQMTGQGIQGVFPPLVDSDWVEGDKGRLIRLILHGMTGEMEVNGVTYSGSMPPWNTFLTDEEIAAVLTYIRTSWGNEASEVTPEEVALVRAATADRKQPWTAAELEQGANQGIPGAAEADTASAPDGQ